MEKQGSNHSGGGGQLGRRGIHVGEWRSRAPTMVGVTSVGMVLIILKTVSWGKWFSENCLGGPLYEESPVLRLPVSKDSCRNFGIRNLSPQPSRAPPHPHRHHYVNIISTPDRRFCLVIAKTQNCRSDVCSRAARILCQHSAIRDHSFAMLDCHALLGVVSPPPPPPTTRDQP